MEFEVSKNGGEFSVKRYGGKRKIFWGLIFIAGALVFLANKLGYLGEIRFWPVVLSICFGAVLINGMIERSFGKMMFALAFLVIVNDKLLGLEAITPWPVLLAAVALTIGLNMMFPGFHRGAHIRIGGKHKGVCSENRVGNTVYYENNFSGTVKYVSGEITNVEIDNCFGATEVYFSDAILVGGSAKVSVDSSFGAVTLYVPFHWQVMMNVDTAFGGAEEKGRCNPTGENTLYVDGDVSFGALEIKYI